MSPQVRVAAVIPAFNPGEFLARSLASVLMQEGVDLEVIVVDDGSTEDITGTAGLLDPRVKLIRTPNRGVSAARNHAVAVTDAEFVAFLDQDDEWTSPHKLRLQTDAYAERPTSSFVYSGFTWVLPEREFEATGPVVATYETNLAGDHICLSSLCVRRADYVTVGGHDIFLEQQQDWDLMLKLLSVFGPAERVDSSLVRYHVHGGNASGDYVKAKAEVDEVYSRHASPRVAVQVAEGRRIKDRLYSARGIDAARAAFNAGNRHEVARHLTIAARIRPLSVPVAVWESVKRRVRQAGG